MSALPRMIPLRTALAMVASALGVFFLGGVAAHAWEGRSGIEARSFFTVAGTLTGVPTSPAPALRLVFHRAGASDCTVDASGVAFTGSAFSALVPYDLCGRGFFDGADISADVLVNGVTVVTGQPINPVPMAQFASVAGQLAEPECPFGYVADPSGSVHDRTICRKRLHEGVFDEVVRVGYGAAAFWIDRFEDSVWIDSVASARLDPTAADGHIGIIPPNGEWVRTDGRNAPPHAAWSVRGVMPTGSVSWFQARELCRMSGKRLPTHEEWGTAARGTPDPADGLGDGRERRCLTQVAGPRVTGDREPVEGAIGCQSEWGVQDMIGNLWEWTLEWHMAVGRGPFEARPGVIVGDESQSGVTAYTGDRMWAGWPNDGLYNGDSTANVVSAADPGDGRYRFGAPSAALRGGGYENATRSGVFTLNLNVMPSYIGASAGFRCVLPR